MGGARGFLRSVPQRLVVERINATEGPDAVACGPSVFTALAGSLLLLGSILGGLLACFLQGLGHLVQRCHVLALPLATEFVSVRALPIGALQNLVQRVALVLDLRGTGLQLAAEV